MLLRKMLRFAQIGLLALLSVEAAEARSFCEDCKQHPDDVPHANALTGEQAQPSRLPPAPTLGGAGSNIGLATNEVSVRACDAQSD